MIKMTFRASITAAMLVVLLCLSGTEALMARVTCHCDTGDVPGELRSHHNSYLFCVDHPAVLLLGLGSQRLSVCLQLCLCSRSVHER